MMPYENTVSIYLNERKENGGSGPKQMKGGTKWGKKEMG